MRTLVTLLIASPLALLGQTIHPVQVGGSTLGPTLPYYAPSTLTIPVGDIVRWTNVSGTHNVDGGDFFFPDNPAPFEYHPEQGDNDWSFQFTFTIPGTYHYQCDTEGHSATQTGVIVVEGENSVGDPPSEHVLSLFPSPATDHVTVDIGPRSITSVDIIGVDGRVITAPSVPMGRSIQISTADLVPGNYVLRLTEKGKGASTLRFTKK
ncbi:MAG: T9SS type A sorting domain-containing protein [Flavobacteriales bacterium]|nr:T9SS type A sorting domain-containing protein [Flavobacteriales bacterium]